MLNVGDSTGQQVPRGAIASICVVYARVLCGSGTPYLMNVHVPQECWGTTTRVLILVHQTNDQHAYGHEFSGVCLQ